MKETDSKIKIKKKQDLHIYGKYKRTLLLKYNNTAALKRIEKIYEYSFI